MKNLLKAFLFLSFLLVGWLGWSVDTAEAAIIYGSGYYTNLCDSGTRANYYSCNPGCDPALGTCRSENDGVVKWICNGKWNQCLESESSWTNYEKLDNVSCGYTVQMSLFDKKCRRQDGSWDNSCNLLGYMVWYSGDCWNELGPTPTLRPVAAEPSSTVVPTSIQKAVTPTMTLAPPTNTPKPTVTPRPTVTAKPAVTPTVVPVVAVCGVKCGTAASCRAGFACVQGVCRNPVCIEDKSCFCKGPVSATASAVTKTNPEAGAETWLGIVGMLALGYGGVKMRKFGATLWK